MELIMSTNINGAVASLQGGRPENQDAYCFGETPNGYLVVVCDGMGGGPGGKTASTLAKTTIANTILHTPSTSDKAALVCTSIKNANTAVFEAATANPALRGMGTTAVVLLIDKRSAIVGHVGDSRLYKMRMGRTVFRTKDHSVVGDMVRQKIITEEQARLSTQSNILNRAVGVKPDVEPEVEEVAYEKGDRFVLCSDGIWGAIDEKSLVKDCTQKHNASVIVESLAEKIDAIGQSNGGHHDNLTLAIVETKTNSQLKESMSKRSISILLAFLAIAIASIIAAVVMYNRASIIPQLEKEKSNLKAELHSRDSIISKLQSDNEIAGAKLDAKDSEANSAKISASVSEQRVRELENKNRELQAKVDELSKKAAATAAAKAKNAAVLSKINRIIVAIKTFRDTKPSPNASLLNANKNNLQIELAGVKDPNIIDNVKSLEGYLKTIGSNNYDRKDNKCVLSKKQKGQLDSHIKNFEQKRKNLK